MARRKIIPNGSIMRWKFNRNRDIYLTVRVLNKVKREKGQWQKYRVEVLLQPDGKYAKYVGKEFLAQGNRLFEPVPKFDTLEEVEAWLESQ